MCLKNRFSALSTGLTTSVARCTALSCDFDPERRRKIDWNCPFCFLYEKSGLEQDPTGTVWAKVFFDAKVARPGVRQYRHHGLSLGMALCYLARCQHGRTR